MMIYNDSVDDDDNNNYDKDDEACHSYYERDRLNTYNLSIKLESCL